MGGRGDLVTGRLRPDEQVRVVASTIRRPRLVVRANGSGDFSTYRCGSSARGRRPGRVPPPGFDALLSRSTSRSRSTARANSTAQADAIARHRRRGPQIDYLAKDYASFRRLMLDRLAVADAPTGASVTRPTSGSRSSSCSRTSPTGSATAGRRRNGGVPRHGTRARLRPPSCAARRLSNARRRNARVWVVARRRPEERILMAGDASRRHDDSFSRVAESPVIHDDGAADVLAPTSRDLRAARRRASPLRNATRCSSTPGAPDCCLPTGATAGHARGRRASTSGSKRATCSSSRRCCGPETGEAWRRAIRSTATPFVSTAAGSGCRPPRRHARRPRSPGMRMTRCRSALSEATRQGGWKTAPRGGRPGNVVLADHGAWIDAS